MRRTFQAITLWQPWASLVAYGAKPFEFRSWPAPRSKLGRVAIHAGARRIKTEELRALLVKLHSPAWRETGLLRDEAIALLDTMKRDTAALPSMAVVCLATVGQPIRGAELAAALAIEHVNDSDRLQHSNYGWPLSDIRRFDPPVPAKGMQGFWNWHGEEPAAEMQEGNKP